MLHKLSEFIEKNSGTHDSGSRKTVVRTTRGLKKTTKNRVRKTGPCFWSFFSDLQSCVPLFLSSQNRAYHYFCSVLEGLIRAYHYFCSVLEGLIRAYHYFYSALEGLIRAYHYFCSAFSSISIENERK